MITLLWLTSLICCWRYKEIKKKHSMTLCFCFRRIGRWLTNVSELMPLIHSPTKTCEFTMKTAPWAMPWVPSLNLRLLKSPVKTSGQLPDTIVPKIRFTQSNLVIYVIVQIFFTQTLLWEIYLKKLLNIFTATKILMYLLRNFLKYLLVKNPHIKC